MYKKICIVWATVIISISLNAQSTNCNYFCNPDFDSTFLTNTYSLVNPECWHTTAPDGLMEIWGPLSGVQPYSGNQFMEINANYAASVYQDIIVNPGATLAISFAHRGRGAIDTMSVSAGPLGGPYTVLGYYGDGPSAWGYYTVNYSVSGPGTNYSIRFTAVHSLYPGVGNFLDAVSVCNTSGPKGIEEREKDLFTVFPNPATERLAIKFKAPLSNVIICVADLTGRILKTTKISESTIQTELDLRAMCDGTYFINVYGANGFNSVQKILIAK